LPMNRQPLASLPTLNGTDVTFQVGGNVLPRVKPIGRGGFTRLRAARGRVTRHVAIPHRVLLSPILTSSLAAFNRNPPQSTQNGLDAVLCRLRRCATASKLAAIAESIRLAGSADRLTFALLREEWKK
jgi:hypothetical protein